MSSGVGKSGKRLAEPATPRLPPTGPSRAAQALQEAGTPVDDVRRASSRRHRGSLPTEFPVVVGAFQMVTTTNAIVK